MISYIKFVIDGDVENNPGPTDAILKGAQGSLNQSDQRFGEALGRKCACITLFQISWSAIYRVGLWDTSGTSDTSE